MRHVGCGEAFRRAERSASGALVVVWFLTRAGSAYAGGAPAAEALFDEGRAAMEQKNYETACQRFRESNRLDPAVGTLLNLAACEEARGRVATAWELFRTAFEKLDANDSRSDYAKSHADALEPRLPKLTMKLARGAPDDVHVRDGDSDYAGASVGVPIPVDPGRHELFVEAPGYASKKLEVTLIEGAERFVEIAPGPKQPNPAASAPASDQVHTPGHDTRTLGFVVGGAGVVGLGVGVAFGVMALGKQHTAESECDTARRTCSQAGADAVSTGRVFAGVSTAGWIVGALGVGAGTYFVLTSDRSGGETRLAAEPSLGGMTMSVRRRF